jgi:hypothetical protein
MSLLPRFTGLKNKDNTDRMIKRGYLAPVYAATLALDALGYNVLNAYHLINPAALTGPVTFTNTVGTATDGPLVGDKLEFLLQSDATSRTATFGTGFAPNGALVATTGKYATIVFIFNGIAWLESFRTVSA